MFVPHTRPNQDGSRNDESAWDSLFNPASTAPAPAVVWTAERRAAIERVARLIGGQIFDHGNVVEIADQWGNPLAYVGPTGEVPTVDELFDACEE